MPRTREIKTITIVSNSSELIVQTLAEIIPPTFAVKTVRYNDLDRPESVTQLASADCVIVDLLLDFDEFSNATKSLRNENPDAKIIVLNDYSSMTFAVKTNGLQWIDCTMNISDFPEQIEDVLKKKASNDLGDFVERFGQRLRQF